MLQHAPVVPRLEAVGERQVRTGHGLAEPRDEATCQLRIDPLDRRAIREELCKVEGVGRHQRVLEVDHAQASVADVEVPRHVVAMREGERPLDERLLQRREGLQQVCPLRGIEGGAVSRLDPVVEEVLQLGPRQGAVEAPAEGDAPRSGLARAGDLQAREQVDGLPEEELRARRIGVDGGPQRRAADILEEKQTVLARTVGIQRGHGEATGCKPPPDVDERQLVLARAASELVGSGREAALAEQHGDDSRQRRAFEMQPYIAPARGVSVERFRVRHAGAGAEAGAHGASQRIVRDRRRHRGRR